ncbi:MAG TPA: DUF2231 domain-containing protein [Gemmatimonadaceae bacterium]|jgi:uncharacterized membrane protein|nr:DUF2231 domain-containing protein [Gemmatimonadaceae bacterium]
MVHFPIAFLPIAIGADLLGRLTGSRTLMTLGKAAIGIAAAGAATAATTGLIAQQEVNADGEALDMLITHRNLNLAATAVATAMATWRGARDEPSAPYLALGLASTALVYYTAYLGGHMVYQFGVGVQPADGIAHGHAPALTAADATYVAKHAAEDLKEAVGLTAKEVGEGKLIPAITHRGGSGEAAAPA